LIRGFRKMIFSNHQGLKIPAGSEIGDGTRIRAETGVLKPHLRIGRDVQISCNRLEIGRGVSIGDRTVITGVGTVRIGSYATIGNDVVVDGFASSSLDIGPLSWIGRLSHLNCSANLRIGRGTGLGPGNKIFTHGCWFESSEGFPLNYQDISIGNDVWLSLNAVVLPGTVIEDHVYIHANAVVNGRLDSGYVYRGNPATRQRSIRQMQKRMTVTEKLEVIARALSLRLVQDGWKGETIDALRFDIPYPYRKQRMDIKLLFKTSRQASDPVPLRNTVVFTPGADPEWIKRTIQEPCRLIVDVSGKKGYGDKELEYLIVNKLQDSILRFYADDEE
jgi:acetyltransferase-like isoleucine patch superfamily enzyme